MATSLLEVTGVLSLFSSCPQPLNLLQDVGSFPLLYSGQKHCSLPFNGDRFCICMKLYQQRKYCWDKLANRHLICQVGIYSSQASVSGKVCPGLSFAYLVNAKQAEKGNLSPCLVLHSTQAKQFIANITTRLSSLPSIT